MKRIYLILLISILSLNIFCQVHWTKYPDNPVLSPGSPGEWDEAGVSYPQVICCDGIYHMWYEGSRKDTTRIGHATSPDGITWTKDPDNPVLDVGPDGAWDDQNAFQGSVLLVDSVFHMWYNGQVTRIGVDMNKIGHATSPDGTSWTKDPNNTVLTNGPSGAWDDTWIYACNVVHADGTFHMWYSGYKEGVGAGIRIGHATSPDGVTWTKDPLNPVMTHSMDWEGNFIFPGGTIFDGSKFHMWYSGGNAWETVIGYANSEDGSQWGKNSQPVLGTGPAGSWESQFVGGAGVLFDSTNNAYKMWYAGFSTSGFEGGGGSIGYAETYEPAWKQMESTGIPKGGSQSCAIDGMIYVFGGLDRDVESLNNTEVYNTISDDWSDLTPVPTDLYSTSAGVINDTIYLVGGWHRENPWYTINTTFAYDPETDSWEVKRDCPKQAAGHASCVLNDKLYLFGGIQGTTDTDASGWKQALAYDPVTDTWDALPDMFNKRTFESRACVYDGQIYVIGGIDESDMSGKVERYNPGDNTWTELAEMPVHVMNHLCVVHNDKIYVFGGDSLWTRSPIDRTYCTDFIQEYDPSTDQWQLMESMPFSRSMMTGQKVGNNVYLIGGYPYNSRDFPSVSSEVWRFNLDSLKEWVVLCEEVLISQESLTLGINEKLTLSAIVLPNYAEDRTLSWSSSDDAVATVSTEGVVTAVSEGKATLTATANRGGCTASCELTVSTVGVPYNSALRMDIFPNPTSDQINIVLAKSDKYRVEIVSNTGQVIYWKSLSGKRFEIDMTIFRKGIYFINIRSEDFLTTRKIVKL